MTVAEELLFNARTNLKGNFGWQDMYASTPWREDIEFYPDIPMPPDYLIQEVQSPDLPDFRMQAWDWLALLESKGIYKPNMTVFDFGCGFGRMAYVFRQYLNARGRYIGFDVFKRHIDFLTDAFKCDHRFAFLHNDIFNKQYNSTGTGTFMPWPLCDASVNHCLALSTFSHLSLEESIPAFSEMARILKPGGTIFATMFRTWKKRDVSQSHFQSIQHVDTWVALFKKHGLEILEDWAGTTGKDKDQWCIILKKRRGA